MATLCGYNLTYTPVGQQARRTPQKGMHISLPYNRILIANQFIISVSSYFPIFYDFLAMLPLHVPPHHRLLHRQFHPERSGLPGPRQTVRPQSHLLRRPPPGPRRRQRSRHRLLPRPRLPRPQGLHPRRTTLRRNSLLHALRRPPTWGRSEAQRLDYPSRVKTVLPRAIWRPGPRPCRRGRSG